MRFSVLAEFFGGFAVLDDLFLFLCLLWETGLVFRFHILNKEPKKQY